MRKRFDTMGERKAIREKQMERLTGWNPKCRSG